ncbi:hypothetical protein [Streptosporangium sp. G12]
MGEQTKRSLSVDALNKIENIATGAGTGTRRVDVDDLVALALVLKVNVSALLLPPTARGTGELTGIDHPVSAFRLWSWAAGELPLTPQDDPACDEEEVARSRPDDDYKYFDYWNKRSQQWDEDCRPHHRIDRARDWARHHEALSKATNAAQVAVNAGMSIPAVIDWLMESLQQHALFERLDKKERVLTTVGSSDYNRMSFSDNWKQLPDEEARASVARIMDRAKED